MRILATCCLALTACTTIATDIGPLPAPDSPATSAATEARASGQGQANSPATTIVEADLAGALVTPSGIPVAINASTPLGYLVTTPCGSEALITRGEPASPTTVVLDPGHGGDVDTGAVGSNGLEEKSVNLAVAEAAQDALTARGIGALLTRTGDYASPLAVRAALADSVDAELMVSIHHNAPTPGPSDVPGVEVFVQHGSPESARLGGLVWEHAHARLGALDVAWAAAGDAGVMTVLNTRGEDAYGILRHPSSTAALVELGYMSNPAEAELFERPEYALIAGEAIADAIEEYLSTSNQGSGFVDGREFNPNPGISHEVCEEPDLY